MQKKLSTILLFSALIGMPAQADKIQGLYLGVGIGSQVNRYDISLFEKPNQYSAKANKQSAVGEISANYNWYFHDQWFAGGEAVIDFSSSDASLSLGSDPVNNLNPITAKIKRDLAYSLAVRLGKTFDKTSIFVRLGAELSEFKITALNSSRNGIDDRTLSHKKTQFAFVPGLGIEFKATESLIIGLDVRTSIYNKQSLRTTNIDINTNITDFRVKYKPRVDQAILSFKFPIK